MKPLSEIWRQVQLFAETRNLVAPHSRVLDELRSQGWRYETDYILRPAFHPGPPIAIHRIFTPEGERALFGSPARQRFDDARSEAARKVFGPSVTPSPI
jgi:hypothetical protein